MSCNSTYRLRYWNEDNPLQDLLDQAVATVPTACGIETFRTNTTYLLLQKVATVPTACGIETK